MLYLGIESPMQKITEHIYVETAFRGCNVGFVVTEAGIVMIDTPQMPGTPSNGGTKSPNMAPSAT